MQSKTLIVATIGPATNKPEIIKKLIDNNLSMARLNFSWGTYDEHRNYINNVREEAKKSNKEIPIIQDLSGPRIQDTEGHHFGGGIEVITDKDRKDLEFGIENNIEYIALSFVGSAKDIVELKELIKKQGGNQKVIAKIERSEAVQNLFEIIEAADGIMVARGDLGNEFPLEEIPFIQHKIIMSAKKNNKMVIVATQMLLSMVENPVPTRAEVSDVAYAILDGADGVMLSEESARGQYPVEAVSMMNKIAKVAEQHRLGTFIGL